MLDVQIRSGGRDTTMPIFEYQCGACGHHFDVLQRAGEAAPGRCPACGKPGLQRALSTPSFHLRGAGWRKAPPRDPKAGGKRRSVGHTLDSGPAHSHDDHAAHGKPGHTHSHGGHTHSHGPGDKHGHKH